MQRHEVGAAEELVELDPLELEGRGPLGQKERIVGDHLHMEAARALGHDRADVAAADDAERLAGELDA